VELESEELFAKRYGDFIRSVSTSGQAEVAEFYELEWRLYSPFLLGGEAGSTPK
jgi:hypothetical protein